MSHKIKGNLGKIKKMPGAKDNIGFFRGARNIDAVRGTMSLHSKSEEPAGSKLSKSAAKAGGKLSRMKKATARMVNKRAKRASAAGAGSAKAYG